MEWRYRQVRRRGIQMKGLIFTYVLTYGGAVVSLFDPFKGLLIYICFAIIKPESLWHWSVPEGGNYSRVVAISLLIGWSLRGFGGWHFGKAAPTVAAIIGFFCWSALSAPFAAADSSAAWNQVEEYAKIVLPFLVGITTIHSLRQLKQMAWVIIVAQGYLAFEFNLTYLTWPEFNANDWTFAGLDRNGIAITMVTALGLAGIMGFYAEVWWQRIIALIAAALMVHVVLFSHSRGGMLALIVTAIVAFLLIPKRPSYIALMVVGLAISLRLAGNEVVERFSTTFADESSRDLSAQSRVDLWAACINVMLANPILGIGPNNWRLVAHNYGFATGKDAHTMWLHVGAELGVVGLLFLVVFYGSTVWRLWRLKILGNSELDLWCKHFGHMVIAGLSGFAVSAQFVSVYAIELPYYVTLLGASALKLASFSPAPIATSFAAIHRPRFDKLLFKRDFYDAPTGNNR